jgi:DNA-binding NtrC family response regulator
MNILIVDDEIDQLETIRRGLKSCGFKVCEASSAEEGLKILEAAKQEIDLILTDYRMQGMNGIQFLEAVRSKYGSFPVILMSGYADHSTKTNAMEYQCNSFLEKPFTLENLTGEINRVLTIHGH